MADGTEDVLELDDELLESGDDEDRQTDGEAEGEGGEGDEPGIPTFDTEADEAAPASEESSVIRDLRQRNRELTAELRKRQQSEAQKPIEVGPEPTLESCEYDEDKFKTVWRQWEANRLEAEKQTKAEAEKAEEQRKAWTARVETYETRKAALNVPDFDAAESEVQAALPEQTQALLMLSPKSAEVVYALSKSPAKLKALSELNLAEAAMMIGELGATVQMKKRAPLPNPDRGLRGNAPLSGTRGDKELERLEREAVKTGDRTALIRYRKKLNATA